MTEFTVNGVRYIGVEVPGGDYIVKPIGSDLYGQLRHGLYVVPSGRSVAVGDIGGNCCFFEVLPAGNYEIAGLVKDLPIDTLYLLEVGYKNCNKYMGQPLNEPVFTPNTLILKIIENE